MLLRPVLIRGCVRLPDGRPAVDALVSSGAGGQGRADIGGEFLLQLEVDECSDRVEVFARLHDSEAGLRSVRQIVDLGARAEEVRLPSDLLLAKAGVCTPEWSSTFGKLPGVNGDVRCLVVFDDGSGSGPALLAGGSFTTAGGEPMSRLAKWDGAEWTPFGANLSGIPAALAVFDDGSGAGPFLYAGGNEIVPTGGFTPPFSNMARWNGQSWTSFAGPNGPVNALTVFEDPSGSGKALVAGGSFTSAGASTAVNIAKWDGLRWAALGVGLDGPVRALTVDDGRLGSGPALYVGGDFSTAGGSQANGIARWNGLVWTPLVVAPNGAATDYSVLDLVIHQESSAAAPTLFAAGNFSQLPGFPGTGGLARWNGGTLWSSVGGGIAGPVDCLAVFDDGAGPALFAAGSFASAGGVATNNIARWDGLAWTPAGSGVGGAVLAMAVHQPAGASAPSLFVGGNFILAGGAVANRLADWNGQSWSSLGTGLTSFVNALSVFDDGGPSGTDLYVGGAFASAGGLAASRLARWDGQAWSPVGSGTNGTVFALTASPVGGSGGTSLFAGGDFTAAGGSPASRVARWDGQGWSGLGSGISGTVLALATYDSGGGAGPALYAGGDFLVAGGVPANRIASWDGQSWSPVGAGLNGTVRALASHDDGSGAGPSLFVGGDFTSSGTVALSRIARWNGQSWSPLSSGMDNSVRALLVHDDGGGKDLYAGGSFTSAGGQLISRVARWDGDIWSLLAAQTIQSGIGPNGTVNSLASYDDGAGPGPALYVGGDFGSVNTGGSTVGAARIARWRLGSWASVGVGLNTRVNALASFDPGDGAVLCAGGNFTSSSSGDSFLAQWGGCPPFGFGAEPGCGANPATLDSFSAGLVLGRASQIRLRAANPVAGLGQLYLGTPGFDPSGCGLTLPGVGELLLSLTSGPLLLASLPAPTGQAQFPVSVPNNPQLVGKTVAFQGVFLATSLPEIPIELSNALTAEIAP